MDAALIVMIFGVLIFLSSMPSLLFWALSTKFLPPQYKAPPKRMTLMSVVFSLLTAFGLNLELEGGFLSVPATVVVLSMLWSILLLMLWLLFRLAYKSRQASEIT